MMMNKVILKALKCLEAEWKSSKKRQKYKDIQNKLKTSKKLIAMNWNPLQTNTPLKMPYKIVNNINYNL